MSGNGAFAQAKRACMFKKTSFTEEPQRVPEVPIRVDPERERYPFCVVWTPLPMLSWILPFIGHIGVCDSAGRIHDFQGTCHIGVDKMLFGDPVKYWDLSPSLFPYRYAANHERGTATMVEEEKAFLSDVARYDAALGNTTSHFRACERYSFLTNNCHSYVARALEMAGYQNRSWGMVSICMLIALKGRYVSWQRFALAHFPFALLLLAAALLFGVLWS